MDNFGHWSAGILDYYKGDIAYVLLTLVIVSQGAEAYGQWLDNEPARKAGTLSPGSRYTAFGRLFKTGAVWGGLFGLIGILYGKH